MDIHKTMDNWRLTSIKQGYPFMNICLRITIAEYPIHGYPRLDVYVEIPAWMNIPLCVDNWRLTSKNHGYPCWYPWIFGNPCMDMLWILGPGTPGRTRFCPWCAFLCRLKLVWRGGVVCVFALCIYDNGFKSIIRCIFFLQSSAKASQLK